MFRIVKINNKYIVEVQFVKWTLFGLKRSWKPYVKSAGLDIAWKHSTYDYALMNLLDEVKKEIESNTPFEL